MARTAALVAARSSAVGQQAQAYEDALREQDHLDQQFAAAAGTSGERGVELRLALAQAHEQAVSRTDQLATELKTRAPQYWAYRSPDAISIAALQLPAGADSSLLHDDEALILFLVARGDAKGLVFAVNRHRAAWARLGMTGNELTARVRQLRAQIDPQGYGVDAAASARSGDVQANPGTGPFDRQGAYELHQALLGDQSIQAVIKDTPVLLWVPSGPLTSLPPGLLVTAPPAGGPAQDAQPAALRATAWLLRSHAVALLPAVSSLRTLRQIRPADSSSTPDPLLAFADPDFSHPASAPALNRGTAFARGFSAYYRDGHALEEALDSLPSLPGTRFEGLALERALGGRPGSLLTGRRASKAELMARNADGRLQQVRVLEFATHGLVAGDVSDLAEPALVLAAGNVPDDELLPASQAATLKLNADWVLLSACNTASPDAPEAQGLSGLSRAFFYAGARSLLVSHWEVRDDVPPILIPAMLHAERSDPHISRAQALRQASLAILDDPQLNAAHPFSWAPFTLVGEAGR
jgi:CHAT domain-containing protein